MKNTKKNTVPAIAELKKAFPYICEEQLKYEKSHNEYKTVAGFLRFLSKINEENEQRANRPDVKTIKIKIDWRKSAMYGYNPHARYWATFDDGTTQYGEHTCSGCGYDKASTVVAKVFNDVCTGMLWRKRHTRKQKPYGVRYSWRHYFEGGIGCECYNSICAFLGKGGEFKHTAWSDTFDQYEVNFK